MLRQSIIPATAGLLSLLLLGGCATDPAEDRSSAYRDYIEVTELAEVKSIRTFGGIDHEVLDDKYVVVTSRDQDYLLEYKQRCDEDPFTQRVKPDVRRDGRRIYAGIDTFRGCHIGALYEVTPDQVIELRNMGLAPGEKPREPQ
jgi:hypothetical protein